MVTHCAEPAAIHRSPPRRDTTAGRRSRWLVYVNIRRTDALYGVDGSIAQLGLFSVLAWVSLPLMALVLFGQFLLIVTAKPVYVANR